MSTNSSNSEENKNTIQVVRKSLRVFESLVSKKEPIGVTNLAEELSTPPSTLYRILSTLKKAGLVVQSSETKKYSLGNEFYFLALSALQRVNLQDTTQPFLRELMEETNETANLVVMGSDISEVVYIQQVTSNATVKGFSLIGDRAPSYATAVGKILLADLDWSNVSEVFSKVELDPLTENTIHEISELRRELEQVRKQGYAVDREETEKGAACIAAPVRNSNDKVVAAISISGPVIRILSESMPNEYVESVKCKSQELSQVGDFLGREKVGGLRQGFS